MINYITIKYYNMLAFFRNVRVLWVVLKEHRCWDYHGLLLAMETLIIDLQQGMDSSPTKSVNNAAYTKDMRVMCHLLKRMRDDQYEIDKFEYELVYGEKNERGAIPVTIKTTPKYDFPVDTALCYHANYKQQDLELFLKLFKRRIWSMWD